MSVISVASSRNFAEPGKGNTSVRAVSFAIYAIEQCCQDCQKKEMSFTVLKSVAVAVLLTYKTSRG